MRSIVCSTVIAALLLAPAAAMPALGAPAAAVEKGTLTTSAVPVATGGRYLYMVRDVERTGDIYVGRFIVIAKSGRRVVGVSGMFYSEGRCLIGKVYGSTQRRLIGEYPGFSYGGDWVPARRLNVRWVGFGDAQRVRGWTAVTADDMSVLSGGGVTSDIIEQIC